MVRQKQQCVDTALYFLISSNLGVICGAETNNFTLRDPGFGLHERVQPGVKDEWQILCQDCNNCHEAICGIRGKAILDV